MTFNPKAKPEARLKAERMWRSRRTPADERIWLYVEKGAPDACWEWSGARSPRGYGKLAVGGKHWRAHRLMWTQINGPIPAGLVVCHRCDNPPCCNPAHLFLGTDADNLKDARDKGRLITSRPGESNGFSKLTADAVIEMRALRASGWKLGQLADRYGIAFQTVSNIVRRDVWRHV